MLRQNLRVRKFVMGEYDTKSVGDRDLAKVPNPLPGDWDATVKRQVSLVLQPERKADRGQRLRWRGAVSHDGGPVC